MDEHFFRDVLTGKVTLTPLPKILQVDFEGKMKTLSQECFTTSGGGGPLSFCANCYSKMRMRSLCQKKLNCSCPCSCAQCQPVNLQRCSACNLVSYCSKQCQREHWRASHKKMCSLLRQSWTSKFQPVEHNKETCVSCQRSKVLAKEGAVVCLEESSNVYVPRNYWLSMGYHVDQMRNLPAKCNCPGANVFQTFTYRQFPGRFPFSLGEHTGVFHGWIDEYLYLLQFFINVVCSHMDLTVRQQTGLEDINEDFNVWRAFFFFNLTFETRREITELMVAERIFVNSKEDDENVREFLHSIEENVSGLYKNNRFLMIIWDAFLIQYTQFFLKLRLVKYRVLNVDSIPEKKSKDLEKFRKFHQSATQILAQSSKFLDGFHEHPNVYLEPGSKCVGCQKDLSGVEAQPQVHHEFLPRLFKVNLDNLNYKKIPIVLGNFEEPKLVCCPNLSCIKTGLRLQRGELKLEAEANTAFMWSAQQCDGCLRWSLVTHKCSVCRGVRYCGPDCQKDNWRIHKDLCSELAGRGDCRLGSRKLTGEKKIKHERLGSRSLHHWDPVMCIANQGVKFYDQL